MIRILLLASAIFAANLGRAAAASPAAYNAPADFTVTQVVAAPNPGAWTCTSEGRLVKNMLKGGEYEGFNFRNRFFADADAADTIPLLRTDATAWNSRREGFYDGATARVYRVIDGKLVNVRTDKISKHRASGWTLTVGDKLVPPGRHGYDWSFDDYNSPVAPYYFAVVAVGKDGTWSAPSKALEVKRPEKCQTKASNEGLVAFKWPVPEPGTGPANGKIPPTPANFKTAGEKDGVFTFSWDEVADPDIAGYVVLISDYPPDRHHGYGLDLAAKAAGPEQHIKKGDMVFIDHRLMDFSRNKHVANRVWNDWPSSGISEIFPGQLGESDGHTWSLVRHPGPIPPEFAAEDRGRTCLRIDMKDAKEISLKQYNHSGPGQTWWPVLDIGRTYVVEFWARQEGMANPNVHFGLSAVYNATIKEDFTLGGEWKKYSFEFTPETEWPAENKLVGQMMLSFTGPGTLWIDAWRIYPKDAGYMTLSPKDVAALRDSGMAFLRTQQFITSRSSYFLDDLTSKAGVVARVGLQGDFESTLPMVLGFLKEAGVNPWLQLNMAMSEGEWQGLVEYLAAPYDPSKDTPEAKPWAFKRYSMGQQKPWTDEFKKIIFEVSNETWNPLFRPWTFSWLNMTDASTGREYKHGELIGLMTGYILEQMKKSPYWPALGAKMEPAVGGWLVELKDDGYGQAACKVCPEIKHNLVANYNGGWDEGAAALKADEASYRLALTVTPHYIHAKNSEFAATRDRLAAAGTKFKIGTYEAGPGYAYPNTISHEEEEAEAQAQKSLAAGTATLDCFLDGAQQGFVLQNFFSFGRGRVYWSSLADERFGGQAYPSWMALSLYNNEGLGDFLVVQPASVPADKLEKTKTRKEVAAAPLTGVYATRDGDRYNVFVLSRKLDNFPYPGDDGYTPVTLNLPFKSAKKITLYKMAGDPRSTNLDAENVKIQKQEIPAKEFSQTFALNAARGADERGLPPAATFLYVFEGTATPELPKSPQGSLALAQGQPATTGDSIVRFLAAFDRPMSDLAPDKVKVTGLTGGTALVERPAGFGGTGFLVSVLDMERPGDLGVEIPAGAISDEAGTSNAALVGPTVNYRPAPPADKIFVQESFDFAGGKTLWTSDSDAGWKGKWNVNSTSPAQRPEGFAVSADKPLEYPGLASSPAHLQAGVPSQSLWRGLDIPNALAFAMRRDKDESGACQVGLTGKTVWISFLIRKDADDKDAALVSLNAGDFYKNELVAVRFGYAKWENMPDDRVWAMDVRDAENKNWIKIPTTVPVVPGETVLMVARITYGKKDSVALYVNPPLTGAPPAAPSAEYTSENGRKLNFRNIVLWGGHPGNSSFDEIRIGDSFKAVTPAK